MITRARVTKAETPKFRSLSEISEDCAAPKPAPPAPEFIILLIRQSFPSTLPSRSALARFLRIAYCELFPANCSSQARPVQTAIESENRRGLRGTEMPEPHCWYVSYAVKSDRDPRRYARVTRTFDSEEHAKLFVREIAADHLRLAAGTINPHSPKRVVSAAEISN
jgi:hypothetical protein